MDAKLRTFKPLISLLAACVLAFGCLFVPAGAATVPDPGTQSVITRAYGRFEETIPGNSILPVTGEIILDTGDIISYDCTYTPRSTSVKFGFIAPDGLFYGVSGSNGSINTTIQVSQRGTYTLAIKNSSNYTVTVQGTVNY